jgi:hypothetical protein
MLRDREDCSAGGKIVAKRRKVGGDVPGHLAEKRCLSPVGTVPIAVLR